MIALKKVNVLVYGQAGAGKTTLIGELTGTSGLGGATTKDVSIHKTASGICFVDRPGIDIPGAVATDAESRHDIETAGWYANLLRSISHWTSEQAKKASWKATVSDLQRRLTSNSAEDRPLALVYVHKAGNPRLYQDHIKTLLGRAHALLVPTFVIIADKWSADKESIERLQSGVRDMVQDIGTNKRGHVVQVHTLSARPYQSGTTTHPSVGIGEFISSLLSHLEPADALTFIRHGGYMRMPAAKRPAPAPAAGTRGADGDAAPGGEATEAAGPTPKKRRR